MPSSIPGSSRWRSAPATARRPTATCRSCSAAAGSPSPSTRASTPSATRAWCRSRARPWPTAPTPISASPSSCRPASRSRPSARWSTAPPHWRAASLMVQQMPEFEAGRIHVDREQREDDWRRAVILMASATTAEMLDPEPAGRDPALSPVPPGEAAPVRPPAVRGALPLQPRAHRPRAALDQARGARRPARFQRQRLGEVRVLLDRIRLRRQRSRPDLRLGGVDRCLRARTWASSESGSRQIGPRHAGYCGALWHGLCTGDSITRRSSRCPGAGSSAARPAGVGPDTSAHRPRRRSGRARSDACRAPTPRASSSPRSATSCSTSTTS